ncbi:MAG TPA: oligosaccharide flippase family protein [Oculatellaceae cyanobacterium]|jgi:O-antigen/teichoic acid export membrane protein
MTAPKKHLLKKNIVVNLFTKMLPILVGIVTLPIILKGLGVEQTGILQIIWALIGYSSFFDLGLGRALTQLISKKLALSETDDIPDIIVTTLVSITVLGLIPAVLLILGRTPLVQFLNVSPSYVQEAERSICWLAVSIPAMLLITCQTGILQSYQKFGWITWLNMPAIIGNFVAPVFMLQYTHHLGHIVAVMVLCRLLMAMLFFSAISKCVPNVWWRAGFRFSLIKPLFHFGKWVTVSNIVNPLMVYLLDRLFLANFFSVRMASYYVVPYGVLQKMTIAPWAIMGVMFPAFSGTFHTDKAKSATYYYKSLLLTMALLFLPVAVVVVFAQPLLTMWMGTDFAENSYRLTQLIAIALYVYSINLVPSGLIQAAGQSDFTAKMQLVEFPFFLLAMAFNIRHFGIMAAPATLLGLFFIEGMILQWYAVKLLRTPSESVRDVAPPLPVS